jgi:hypothetical protein
MKKLIMLLAVVVFLGGASQVVASFYLDESGVFQSIDSEHAYFVWSPSQSFTEVPACAFSGSLVDTPEVDSLFDACGNLGAGTYTILETVGGVEDCSTLNVVDCEAHNNYQSEGTWEYIQ